MADFEVSHITVYSEVGREGWGHQPFISTLLNILIYSKYLHYVIGFSAVLKENHRLIFLVGIYTN